MEILFLLGRLIFGGFFIMSGMNHMTKTGMLTAYAASKGLPMPRAAVLLTGLMLIFGGFGMVSGVSVQWAVLSLSMFLVPVAFKMHDFWNVADPQGKMYQMMFFLRNMALFGASLMMLMIPEPWPFSFW